MNEQIEDNKIAADADAIELKRLDNCQRQARFRARKDLQLEGATVKQQLQIIANRKSALAATIKAADVTMHNLTPSEREIFDSSEVFQEGLPDGGSVGLKFLQGMMYDVIEYVKADLFDEIRADWIMEAYQDFILTFPFAKQLAFPRSLAPVEEGEAREYPLKDFFAAHEKYRAHRNITPVDDAPYVPEAPRKRGRPRKVPVETTVNDVGAALLESWSRPQPQAQYGAVARAQKSIAKDIKEALPYKPVVFEPQS